MKNKKEQPAGAHAWFTAAQDDLDAAGILLIHKKYGHTCFFAHQAVKKMLTAILFLYRPADVETFSITFQENTIPQLLKQVQKVIPGKLAIPEKLIEKVGKLELHGFPQVVPGPSFSREEGDYFSMTAYESLSAITPLFN